MYLSRFFRLGRRGAIAMLGVITLPVVVGIGGGAINVGYISYRTEQLQATTDAAVLAGSAMLPNATAAAAAAISYAQKNMPVAQYGTVLRPSDIQTGNWNSTTRSFTASTSNPTAIKITLRRTAANGNPDHWLLGGTLSFATVDLTRSGVATFGTASAWDIMIVHDVSQSFSLQILSSKAADQKLLSCQQNAAGSASQAGLTAFTGFGTVMAPMGALNILTKITSLAQCGLLGMPACSGSNLAAGLYQAKLALTGAAYHPSANLAGKAVVLVTDGIPNATSAAQPYGTAQGGTYTCSSGSGRTSSTNCTDTDLQAFGRAQADALWANNISVFTVFYSGSSGNPTSDAAYLASLVRGKGKAYVAPTASQLSTMMTNICSSMPHALVQ